MTHQTGRRFPVTLPLLALIVVALVVILRPPAMPYLDLLRQGDAHAAGAERTAAVAAYREAASLRPGDPVPHLRLAQVYLDWGRTDDALAAVAEAGRLGAEGAELDRLRVAIYAARADWPAVVEHAQSLLAREPADDQGGHALARAYVELREWDAARAEYEALLLADPSDSLAHERLGILLLGEDPAAVQHLFAAQTDLAGRLLAAENAPGVAEDPAYASALLGGVLFEQEEWALATRCFEQALSHSPDFADAHAYLGYVLGRMGHSAEARSHLLRAVALAPDSVVAHTFLGLHYESLGDLSSARAEYESAYDLDPDNPATCVEIGQTWAAEGRYVAAELWLRQAVSLRPDDPALWEVLARFYLDYNISGEGRGIEAAETLTRLSPGDARAHDLHGWAALQVGDYDAAEQSLQQALALDPELAEAHYHVGLLRAAQGAQEEARRAFARAVDLDTTGKLVPLVERAVRDLAR
jgi:tetratricopeptide (TPR) repeat protein